MPKRDGRLSAPAVITPKVARRVKQLSLTPDRIQIHPSRSSARNSRDYQIYGWGWYCPRCDTHGGAYRLSWHHPERDVPPRDRCFRFAYRHMEKYHGWQRPGVQLELTLKENESDGRKV